MVLIIKKVLFSLGLLLSWHFLSAQYTISGRVLDASTGEGLSYVNVHLDSSSIGVNTDQKGNFTLENLPSGTVHLTFTMIGFQTSHVLAHTSPIEVKLHPEIYLADEIVISATKKTQSLHLAPASVSVVTQAALTAKGIRSFDDAFHDVSGIQVTRSSGSNVQSLSIRGASETAGGGIGNRVLLLLDGRPAITPESGGALWNLVPLGAIERIEVIKGAYSSLFGSSAMGGVINVITLNADTVPHTDFSLEYGLHAKPPAYTMYDGYHDFYRLGITHRESQGKWSYVFNGGARGNEGHREKSSFTTYNAFGKLTYHFSPNRSFQVSAMYNDIFNDTPATWLSRTDAYRVAEHRKDDTQHKREINADAIYTAYAHANVKYSTRFYYYGGITDFVFNDDPGNDSTNVNFGKQFIDTEKVIVHRGGNNTQLDISIGNDHYLIAGIEVQRDYIDGRPDTVLYGVHTAWNFGAFVQDEWMISDRFIITGGIRFDEYSITNIFSEGNISPKIAAVYKATSRVSIRALLARAFRNPSIAERYTKFEQGGGLSFLPNPLLRAEKLILSAELGARMTITPQIKIDASIFYNRYKDLISYQQRSFPGEPLKFEVINLNNAIMEGFEITADYLPLSWLKLQAGYSYLNAWDASEGRFNDVLPYKSKHTGFASVYTSFKKFNASAQARGRSRIDEVFIYPGSEPEGYIIYNGRIGYSINPKLDASFSIQNITNKQYEEIERYRMEGRTNQFGLHLSL